MKLNCLIVDDEPLALDVLEQHVKKAGQLNLLGRCNNAIEALEIMNQNPVDLLFLDIQMPEVTGIDFVKSLTQPPVIVFTTAYQHYALEGYDLNVTDYLLKPISFDRFMKAVQRAEEIIQLKKQSEDKTSGEDEDEGYFFVKSDQKLVKLRYSEISFIEALADYVKIHTHEKRIITLQTMKKMEEKLPADKFIRVHRSYIVSIDKIKAVSGSKIEVDGQEIPIGKNYKESLFNYLYSNNILK